MFIEKSFQTLSQKLNDKNTSLLLTLLGLAIDIVATGISVMRSDIDISPASLL